MEGYTNDAYNTGEKGRQQGQGQPPVYPYPPQGGMATPQYQGGGGPPMNPSPQQPVAYSPQAAMAPYPGQAGPYVAYSNGQTVTIQPGAGQPTYVYPNQPLVNPPPDYLGLSIFSCICCCWLIGIFAILSSVKSREASRMGDQMTAQTASDSAKTKSIVAIVLGLICTGGYIGLGVWRNSVTENYYY